MTSISVRNGNRQLGEVRNERHYGRKDNVDILHSLFLHFEIQIIPKKMPEVPEWKPEIEDSFREQVKRDLKHRGMPFKDYVHRHF